MTDSDVVWHFEIAIEELFSVVCSIILIVNSDDNENFVLWPSFTALAGWVEGCSFEFAANICFHRASN